MLLWKRLGLNLLCSTLEAESIQLVSSSSSNHITDNDLYYIPTTPTTIIWAYLKSDDIDDHYPDLRQIKHTHRYAHLGMFWNNSFFCPPTQRCCWPMMFVHSFPLLLAYFPIVSANVGYFADSVVCPTPSSNSSLLI